MMMNFAKWPVELIRVNQILTTAKMLWWAVKDKRHNLGVNKGEGMYWQGTDNTHRPYGPLDEGPRQLAEGVPHACIARWAN